MNRWTGSYGLVQAEHERQGNHAGGDPWFRHRDILQRLLCDPVSLGHGYERVASGATQSKPAFRKEGEFVKLVPCVIFGT